jgi:uncharacterized protein
MARLYQRQGLLVRLPIVLAAVAVASWLWLVVWPMPPTRLSINTAGADGAYFLNAQRYAEQFAKHGVTLDVLTSEGSQQNLERLRRPNAPDELAFVQGGFGYLGASFEGPNRSRVQTLANVNIEPVWIFSINREIDALSQLQGLRLAIGPEGSGHRRVALKLLEQARISNADLRLTPLTGNASVQGLRQGTVDAVLMVAAPESVAVQNMLGLPGIRIAHLKKSAAITERNPYLELRLLAQGSLGIGLPAEDTTLLTTLTSLVASETLHPALQRLAAAVAQDVHAGAGLFHRAGDFPALRRIDFPTSAPARQTLAQGLPLLERTLPFWWAQLAERLLGIGLPVALLAWYLMRLIPAYLRWVVESRVNRWYGELKFIENDLSQPALTGINLSKYLARLDGIDKAMLAFATPKDLIARWYTLHHHIEFVRQQLYRLRGR